MQKRHLLAAAYGMSSQRGTAAVHLGVGMTVQRPYKALQIRYFTPFECKVLRVALKYVPCYLHTGKLYAGRAAGAAAAAGAGKLLIE
jgi:hypothetical protein